MCTSQMTQNIYQAVCSGRRRTIRALIAYADDELQDSMSRNESSNVLITDLTAVVATQPMVTWEIKRMPATRGGSDDRPSM
jgi:hypothetical protein